jgi:cell division topological specificity factor
MGLPIFDFLRGQKKNTATKAKDRLQIILAHERAQQGQNMPEYLPKMRQEILDVISKYVNIDPSDLKISIDEEDGLEVLEMNLVLPESK